MMENKENLKNITEEEIKIECELKLKEGKESLLNEYYEEAWESFVSVFNNKKASKEYRGEAGYWLCEVMKKIPVNDKFISELICKDTDLIRKSKLKTVTNEYARTFLGRKYLRKAADDYGHLESLKNYTMYCFGHGSERSFAYQYDNKDALVGLQWIKRLMLIEEDEAQALGYAMKCKYHIVQYTKNKNPQDIIDFCDNAIKAIELVGETNGYVTYYYAFVCSDPSFKEYNEGEYYNPKKGYEMFVKTIELLDDPIVIADCKKRKQWFESKFPDLIK